MYLMMPILNNIEIKSNALRRIDFQSNNEYV